MNPGSFDPHDCVTVAVLSMADVTVVTVAGRIDMATCHVMADPVFDHIDAAPVSLVLDLGKIARLDPECLAVLLQAQDRARLTGTQLAVVAPEGSAAAWMLRTSGLARALPVYPTLTAAVRTVLACNSVPEHQNS